MHVKRLILTASTLCLISASALAADWQATYYGTAKGTYFLDTDSLVDAGGGFKKFWVLFGPRVQSGTPGEGYAYAKHLVGINCKSREATRYESIYTDENGADHPAEVKLERNVYAIVPDSEDDFWWIYLCKSHTAKDLEALGTPITGSNMKAWLADQTRFTRENSALVNRIKGQ